MQDHNLSDSQIMELHFHPRYNPLQTAGRQLTELNEIRSYPFNQAEYVPDRITRYDILHTVKDDLLGNTVLLDQTLDIKDFPVTGPNLEEFETRPQILFEMNIDTEGFIGPVDGDQDIPLVDNVTAEDAVDDIGRDHFVAPAEKQGCARNIFPLCIYLFVTNQKGAKIQRTHGVV